MTKSVGMAFLGLIASTLVNLPLSLAKETIVNTVSPESLAAQIAAGMKTYPDYEAFWKTKKIKDQELRAALTDFFVHHPHQKMPVFVASGAALSIFDTEKPDAAVERIYIVKTAPLEFYHDGIFTIVKKPEDVLQFLQPPSQQQIKSVWLSLFLSEAIAQIPNLPDYSSMAKAMAQASAAYEGTAPPAQASDQPSAGFIPSAVGVKLVTDLHEKINCSSFLAGKESLKIPVKDPGGSFTVKYQRGEPVEKFNINIGQGKTLEFQSGKCAQPGKICFSDAGAEVGYSAFPKNFDKMVQAQTTKDQNDLDKINADYLQAIKDFEKSNKPSSSFSERVDFITKKQASYSSRLTQPQNFLSLISKSPQIANELVSLKKEIQDFNVAQSKELTRVQNFLSKSVLPDFSDDELKKLIACGALEKIGDQGTVEKTCTPKEINNASILWALIPKFDEVSESQLREMRPIAVPADVLKHENDALFNEVFLTADNESELKKQLDQDDKTYEDNLKKVLSVCVTLNSYSSRNPWLNRKTLEAMSQRGEFEGKIEPYSRNCFDQAGTQGRIHNLKIITKKWENSYVAQQATSGINEVKTEVELIRNCCDPKQPLCGQGIAEANQAHRKGTLNNPGDGEHSNGRQ